MIILVSVICCHVTRIRWPSDELLLVGSDTGKDKGGKREIAAVLSKGTVN